MGSPTSRSKALLEERGYMVDVVERWIPGANIRRDLFHLWDLLAIHRETGAVCAVQTTSASGVSARLKKIGDSPNIATVRKAGWALFVHGWRKKGGRWVVREEDVS